jgi:hypothetical protein
MRTNKPTISGFDQIDFKKSEAVTVSQIQRFPSVRISPAIDFPTRMCDES